MESNSEITVSFVLGSCGGTIAGNEGSWQAVSGNEICPPRGYASPENFKFDHAFGANAPIGKIYEKSVSPLVKAFLDGYSGSVLDYGPRSSGKFDRLFGTEQHDKNEDCIVLESVKDVLKLSQNGEKSFCFRVGYYLIRSHDKLIGKPNTTETMKTSKSCKPEELVDTTTELLKEVRRQESKDNGLYCALFWIRSFIVGTTGRPLRSLLTFAELPCTDLTDIRIALEEWLQELAGKSNNAGSPEKSMEQQLGDVSKQAQGAGKDLKILKVTFRAVVKQELKMAFICNGVPSAVRQTLAVAAFAKQASSLKINPVRTYFDPAAATEMEKQEMEKLRNQLEKELEDKTAAAVLARDQLAVIEEVNGSSEPAVETLLPNETETAQDSESMEGHLGSDNNSPLLLASRVNSSFEKMEIEFEKMRQAAKIWKEDEKVVEKLKSEKAELVRKSKQLDEDKKNLKEKLAEWKRIVSSQRDSVDHLRKSQEQLQFELSCERAGNEILSRNNEQLQQQLAEQRKFLHFVKTLGDEATRRDDEVHSVLKSSAGFGMLAKQSTPTTKGLSLHSKTKSPKSSRVSLSPCGTGPERGFKRPLSADGNELQLISDDEFDDGPLTIVLDDQDAPEPSEEEAVPEKKAKSSPD